MTAAKAPGIVWSDERSFRLAGHDFVLSLGNDDAGDAFVVAKPPDLVRRYERLVEDERPRTVVELGVFRGGSAALLALLAPVDHLLAFDLDPDLPPALAALADEPGMQGRITLHPGVDQSDAATLRCEVAATLGDRPLDLVIDDASHLLEPTRASFEALFPLLRPGGVYLVEDWCLDSGAALVVDDSVVSEQARRLRAMVGLFGQPGFEPPPALVDALSAAAARVPMAPGGVDQPVTGLLLRMMHVAAAADLGEMAEAAAGLGRPLSDLAVELLTLATRRPTVVEAVTADANWLLVRRGPAEVPAGEPLLGPDPARDVERFLGLRPVPPTVEEAS